MKVRIRRAGGRDDEMTESGLLASAWWGLVVVFLLCIGEPDLLDALRELVGRLP